MICVRRQDLYVSWGDTVDLIAVLNGFVLDPSDVVTVSIRGYGGAISKKFSGISGSEVPVYFTAEEFGRLPPGRYRYDIMVEYGGVRQTINFPGWIVVEEVVHGGTGCMCM